MTQIHPSAIVSPDAVIGEGCQIGPFCQIGPDVVLGKGNILVSNVIIDGCSQIGDNNRFFSFAVIGTESQDLKYQGGKTGLQIGNGNTIREFVTMNRSSQEGGKTILGDRNLMMEYVHVGHDCVVGSDCVVANSVQMAGHLVIDDKVSIGGMTAIHQFVRVGYHAFVGGASAVKKDIAPFTRGMGNPYKTVGLNSVGLLRAGFASETLEAIKKIYRLFYRQGLNVSQALEALEKWDSLTSEQMIFTDFVRASQRGLSN
ncbi:MAG: acyl-ACP--UDP-N-acetylglucosamine O-acyltransferase [Candidatus Cloacimonadaceae bacterium]|jgi:UDP-N-acetylglucosamine acyltransferase|nr:acyl-ACP--UDP-N-acetylglucosamine O-acyltransferase [Candidatus Cloacimonadota bacterium]MDX9948928.1 acyl-ACP--UDP-N-acetylglucosamine O-acyltransferase [Candidatus Syntrophosphaera sp.]